MPTMLERGTRVGPYEVVALIGAGGMGEVYQARDCRLDRDVALKILSERLTFDQHRRLRFEREARLLASLNHPNIATLHSIEEYEGSLVLVLELVSGQTLADRLATGSLPLGETLEIAAQIAAALDAAHERGIVHRDLKPGNIQLRADRTVKLLDFGIAKVFAPAPGETDVTEATATAIGMSEAPVVGTPAYMSPEQARGAAIDRRADVWAFGCILYEMLTGQRAFPGDRVTDVLARVLEREPDFDAIPASVPPTLRRLLERCLAKDIRHRLRDMGDARLDIQELLAVGRSQGPGRLPDQREKLHRGTLRRITALAIAGAGAIAVAGFGFHRLATSDARWISATIPKIEKHLDVANFEAAYALARQVEARDADNPDLADLWPRITWRVTIPSEPPGATVYRQSYLATDDDWELLGRTPLENIRIPHGLSRLRFELKGHRTLLRAIGGDHLNWAELAPMGEATDSLAVGPDSYVMDTEASLPADKVRVPGGNIVLGGRSMNIGDFFIGRHEVTNAEFKEFVDAGGYGRPEWWDPIVLDGGQVPFRQVAARFTDRTGRPGPSTWEAGDYPDGQDEYPVAGVSWYEAAAYARFRGEELPTAHHWQRSLANSMFPWLLPISNFGGDGPRAVTTSRAMSHVGAFDLSGNVREWTATAIGNDRIIAGGGWNDPYYIAGVEDTSAPPGDRSASNGIRLAVTHDPADVAAELRAAVQTRSTASPELSRQPVSADIYAAYGRVFDYSRNPLKPSIEATDRKRAWSRERISFAAGYGSERMLLYLYLPTDASPPYQTVLYWPGWDTFRLDDVDLYFSRQIDFIVKSGRAVAFPVYRGTFERRTPDMPVRPAFDTTAYRDNVIETVKDLRRTIDYLETRPEIDPKAFALFGYSWGGVNGPIALAHEPRLVLGMIDIGLLPPMNSIPEVDPLNALPRIHVPVLMISGEFDPMVPVANARRYFELIGSSPADKKHVIALGGHFVPRALLIRETLDWLDQHLGRPRP